MAQITINGLNIADNINFIVEELTYRQTPDRDIISLPLSTRPGEKLVTTEWRTKQIIIKGRVFNTTASGIEPVMDILEQNFAVQSAQLVIDANRTYTVQLEKLDVPTQFYNISMLQYTATLKALDPFAYGPLLTVSGTVASGVTTFSGTVTISGNVFCQPTITLTPTNGTFAGDSGYSQFQITYTNTGEQLTMSGTNSGDFQFGVATAADYNNFLVTISGTSVDYSGVFARWQPGIQNFTISIPQGSPAGYYWVFSYQPRYYE